MSAPASFLIATETHLVVVIDEGSHGYRVLSCDHEHRFASLSSALQFVEQEFGSVSIHDVLHVPYVAELIDYIAHIETRVLQ